MILEQRSWPEGRWLADRRKGSSFAAATVRLQRLRSLPRSEGNAGRAEGDLQDLNALIENGSLLHRLGKTDEAIAHFDAARRIALDHELVPTNLVVALAASGQRHDAVVPFRKFLRLNQKMSTFGIGCSV